MSLGEQRRPCWPWWPHLCWWHDRRSRVDLEWRGGATASNAVMDSTSLLCPVWMKGNRLNQYFIFSFGCVITFTSVQRRFHHNEHCQETFFPWPLKWGPHGTHSVARCDYFEYLVTACRACLIVVGVACAQLASQRSLTCTFFLQRCKELYCLTSWL